MRMKGKKVIFDIKDTFSMSHTLDKVICAGLKKFKEVITSDDYNYAMGVPFNILVELFPNSDDRNHTNEEVEFGGTVWLSYIDMMIYAFENKEPDISDYDFDFVSAKGDGDAVKVVDFFGIKNLITQMN